MRDEKGIFTFSKNSDEKGHYTKRYYNPESLEDVNKIRQENGSSPLSSLDGYCMSTGCSCRDHKGKKGLPICGLFKSYEADGVKRDFINQLFGI